MTPQKTNNKIIADLVGGEGAVSPVANVRRIIIRLFNKLKEELKEDIQTTQGIPRERG
jgi:hypothetical protein